MERLLRVEKVTQRFGGLTALDQVQMHVDRGEIIGVIGPNGSGKSTMFNVITGMYKPAEGKILFKEEEITGLAPHVIAQKGLARTFQNIRLFEKMTAMDNVIIGMHSRTKAGLADAIFHTPRKRKEERESEEKARELLKLVNLYDVRYEKCFFWMSRRRE